MGYSHDEWTPLIIHEKMAGNRDAQSHAQIIIIKQNSPRAIACLGSTRCFGLAMECACWWLGEYKPLPFCLGTAYNACSMEDTTIS